MGEVELAALLCAFLSGAEAETRQYFDVHGIARYVRVDCETQTHVIEIGLDAKPSSRDSLHQALFAAHLTGKLPMLVMIDRDGSEGRFEHEARITTQMAGVAYARCSADAIVRWAATRGLVAEDQGRGPQNALTVNCDLSETVGRASLPSRKLASREQ